ncbi:protein tyrosine kinase [Hydrogenophaga sp. Root209]|uniref:XrtA-associated tyrosine autokinase n=1 Tax=unclassified Hydrogenophaga TaxID=2610897 RepID=UPI0006FB7622|nr:XrtA-associated tyrosine autokinase [Hydrogenophaga sp. Root209]KRB98973.1 protein tyrosine kinase [Hydrogenophaga sp. Root209]
MSSLIEKAAQRLEQLRQAGVDIAPPDVVEASAPSAAAATTMAAPTAPVQKSVGEVERTSRAVRLDVESLAINGYVTPNAPRAAIADQFRVIKRPLLANATGKGAAPVANGNLIMVTSAMPGEGKSFTAVNLAMSIAMELDYRVLLVDADVSRPSLRKTLNLPAGPGLLDLLIDNKLKMADVLLRTNVDKLSLLLSGTPHPRATELLASDAMTVLIEELGQRYPDRIIIFDSPPLLLTTEARVLASHMGQILMVVHAEKTLRSQVLHALTTIDACPVKLLMLNQARGGDQDAYGYGYGYGFGYGQSVSQAAESNASVSVAS